MRVIAVYDLKGKTENCVGVWDSMEEAAKALGSTRKSIYRNLKQTEKGRKFSRKGYCVRLVETEESLIFYPDPDEENEESPLSK